MRCAYSTGHKDHECDHQQHHGNHHDEGKGAPFAGDEDIRIDIADGRSQAHHDAREDNQRHAVADPAVGDLFTEPHDEHGSGGHGHDREQHECGARIDYDPALHGFQALGNSKGLDDGKGECQITGPFGDLFLA
jgi:hypothetical protein